MAHLMEWWLILKRNDGSTSSDRWFNLVRNTHKKIILAVIVVIIAVLFFIYKQVTTEIETSFNANITDIFGKSVILLGIPENDINHRGKFQFDISDEKINILDVNGNKTDRVNLKVGDLVRVTYKGPVLETSPVIIQEVITVQIVE